MVPPVIAGGTTAYQRLYVSGRRPSLPRLTRYPGRRQAGATPAATGGRGASTAIADWRESCPS